MYREILRLYCQGLSKRSIAASCRCSRNTLTTVLERATECDISWPLSSDVTDGDMQGYLFPSKSVGQGHRLPDYKYIRKELAKKEVTLTLLWEEHCRTCFKMGKRPK